ncbi:hypothetical protein ElyMa_002654700 [Elysia marginata]|uniref:Uncharacterized protein n=1 Tax=Elysia marginata TaxID=1093978 RepID=A0AAV4H8L7_9GAST|nr:hypothetical protein ElyMa_002654700 [Elysia marginata]
MKFILVRLERHSKYKSVETPAMLAPKFWITIIFQANQKPITANPMSGDERFCTARPQISSRGASTEEQNGKLELES